MTSRYWRVAAGGMVLAVMLAMGVVLIPPYARDWKFQSSINQLVEDPGTAQKTPELIRANVVDRAAGLGLPVHLDDVHVTRSGDELHIEVLYVVHVDLPVYTVDLHFRPRS